MKNESPRDIFRRRLRNVITEEIDGRLDAFSRQVPEGTPLPRINQGTIAEECGINSKTLNSYIRVESPDKSKGALPRFEQLVAIAQKLNVSLDYLFGLTEVKELHHIKGVDAPTEIDDERKRISNYTGLSSEAMDTLTLYVRTKRHLSMLNTVNWLLQSVDMGSMLSEYEALGNCDFPAIKIPDESSDSEDSTPPEMPPLDENTIKEAKESASAGPQKESLRMMAEALVGSSVLQLIDSYLHTDFDCCDLYDITADGSICKHADGLDGDAIPLSEVRAAALGCDLVENYYLEQIKKALYDMKHHSKAPV